MKKMDTKHLLDTYLSFASPSEVNISASLKNRITSLIKLNDNSCASCDTAANEQGELLLSLESAQAEVKVKISMYRIALN